MALGKHYGSFAKGFMDAYLAAMKLSLMQDNAKYNNQFLAARARYFDFLASGGKLKGVNNPELQRQIDEGNRTWGSGPGTGTGTGGGGGGPPPNASDFEKFKYGLTGEESGGNYGIVNRIGATGRYQIMPFNIGPWTKQYLGKEMTQQEFRNDPAAQDKVFEGKVNDLYRQYGDWRDVASVWHSGVPYDQAVREGRHDINETTANYVDHVMSQSRLGADGTSSPTGVKLADAPASGGGVNTGPNGIYANIPVKDSKGRDQLPMFNRWNPDPVGNEAGNLKQLNPDMQRVIARARADNPDLKFVLGNGKRSAADQDWAKSVGWSQVGSKDGGDAATHMKGNAADLWALDDQGRVTFDPAAQSKVTAAIKDAAKKEGVKINAGDDWRNPDKPHFELAAPTAGKTPTKGPDKGKVAQAAPEGPPILHTPYQVAGDAGAVTEAGAERAKADLEAHRAAPERTVIPPYPGTDTSTTGTGFEHGMTDPASISDQTGRTAPPPDIEAANPPGSQYARPEAPGMGGRGLPATATINPQTDRSPVTMGPQPGPMATINPQTDRSPEVVGTINPNTDTSPVNMGPYPRADDGSRPDLKARSPATTVSSPARIIAPTNAIPSDPRFVTLDYRPNAPANDPSGRGGGGPPVSTALDLSHLWGPNPPLSQQSSAPPPPPPSAPMRPHDDWSSAVGAPDMSDEALGEQIMGSRKGGPITRRVSRYAAGGAIPSRPAMMFAAGGGAPASAQYPTYTPAAPKMTGLQGNELAANQFMLGLPGMTPVDTNNPIPGYYTSYGPGQGGAGGQTLIQDWSRMTPAQQKQYNDMIFGTWQPPADTPAAAPAAPAAPAPAPVINPPSVQNITNYAGTPSDPSGVNTIDPTSTTTTGTPGVPTTGLQAATYDPNKIATTGTGSTTNSTGGTDYSTDPNDQTKQILSRKGGPIRRFATGGAIPSRPMTRFADGGGAAASTLLSPNYSGPTPGGGWAGTPYAQMAPNQQTWANNQQTLLSQERANANNPGWSGWSQLSGTPAAIWPTAAAPAAPTPLNEPGPSAQNITTPQTDVTTIDPTSTTTTGTPGVPTTGLLAATYDPNNIATTGTGSKTDATGSTNYSTDPKDQTTQILSRKGGPISRDLTPRNQGGRRPIIGLPPRPQAGALTRRVTHPDVSARNIGTQKYDDGGGVSPSSIGAPPGATGGAPVPPIYYNPATYAGAGAPVGKGVTPGSVATFGAGAIPSLPMARGGVVTRYDDGGDVASTDDAALDNSMTANAAMSDYDPSPPLDMTPTSADQPGYYMSGAPSSSGGGYQAQPSGGPSQNPSPDQTMPQIKDAGGNPSRGLISAISDGLHWLGDHLGLVGGAQAAAIAPDPQIQTNRQQHVNYGPDTATYMSPQNLEELKDIADPGHQLQAAYRSIAGLEQGYKWALARGDSDTAARLAASMLHASVVASQNLSQQAADALYKGDLQGSVDKMNQASDAIPDGRLVHATLNKDGTVTITGSNLNDEVLWRQHGAAQTILERATSLGSSGKLQWDSLEGQAATHDRTFAEMAANRTKNQLARGQEEQIAEASRKFSPTYTRTPASVPSPTQASTPSAPTTPEVTPRVSPGVTTASSAPAAGAPAPTTTATATAPTDAINRGPTGHGGALPGVTGGDIASTAAQPVSAGTDFNSIAATLDRQEDNGRQQVVLDAQDRFRDQFVQPPDQSLIRTPADRLAYNEAVANANKQNAAVTAEQNKYIEAGQKTISDRINQQRQALSEQFSQGQQNRREEFSQREQDKRANDAADRAAKAEADKLKLAQQQPMAPEQLRGVFTKTPAPDSGMEEGSMPIDWYANSPHYATDADGQPVSSKVAKANMGADFDDPSKPKGAGGGVARVNLLNNALVNTQQFNPRVSTDQIADLLMGAAKNSYKYYAAPRPIDDGWGTRYAVNFVRGDGSQQTILVPEADMNNVIRLNTFSRDKQKAAVDQAAADRTRSAIPSRPSIFSPDMRSLPGGARVPTGAEYPGATMQ